MSSTVSPSYAECPKGTAAISKERSEYSFTVGFWEGEEPAVCEWEQETGYKTLKCPTFTARVSNTKFSVISKQGKAIPFKSKKLGGEQYQSAHRYYSPELQSKIFERRIGNRYINKNAPKAVRRIDVRQDITPCREASF